MKAGPVAKPPSPLHPATVNDEPAPVKSAGDVKPAVCDNSVWRDEDGLLWRVVAVRPNGVYVKRADLYGAAAVGQRAVQTHPAYFDGAHWTKVEDSSATDEASGLTQPVARCESGMGSERSRSSHYQPEEVRA